MSKIIIGIDPGLKGGIVTLRDGEVIATRKMPIDKANGSSVIDWNFLTGYLMGQQAYMVAIEKVHSMPKQGVSSTFTFGVNFGGLMGVCAGLAIPYVLVRPQEWQKTILSGIDKDLGKARSRIYCKQRWPNIDPLHKNDGVSDAACIGLWCSMFVSGQTNGKITS